MSIYVAYEVQYFSHQFRLFPPLFLLWEIRLSRFPGAFLGEFFLKKVRALVCKGKKKRELVVLFYNQC